MEDAFSKGAARPFLQTLCGGSSISVAGYVRQTTAETALALCPDALAFETIQWNDFPDVRINSNCYAYALNRPRQRIFGFDPGQLANRRYRERWENQADFIIPLAQEDGLILTGKKREMNQGHYSIALLVDPGRDYHWVRENPNGTWSHKMGSKEADLLKDHLGVPVKGCIRNLFLYVTSQRENTGYRIYRFEAYFNVPRRISDAAISPVRRQALAL